LHLNTQNNYWWYIECVKLHMVVRHLKNLRTPGVDDFELMKYMDFLLTFFRHVAAEVIYVLCKTT
jgi:hypothetical protein